MDLATAKSQRTALVTRINAFIAWSATADVQALDFYEIKSKIDRYEANFKPQTRLLPALPRRMVIETPCGMNLTVWKTDT